MRWDGCIGHRLPTCTSLEPPFVRREKGTMEGGTELELRAELGNRKWIGVEGRVICAVKSSTEDVWLRFPLVYYEV